MDETAALSINMFKYVITGDGSMAVVILSDHDYFTFRKGFFEHHVQKINSKSHHTVYKRGVLEFINPKVWMADDYLNYCPGIIDFPVPPTFQKVVVKNSNGEIVGIQG